MEEKMAMVTVSYTLSLTGSKFFDTVIYMRAMDLTRDYPGVSVAVHKDNTLTIRGSLHKEGAERLNAELGYYGTTKIL